MVGPSQDVPDRADLAAVKHLGGRDSSTPSRAVEVLEEDAGPAILLGAERLA
jgi:hypothetical protein